MPSAGATDALKILVLSGILDPGDFLQATTASVEVRLEAGPVRVKLLKITSVLGFLPYTLPDLGAPSIESGPSTPEGSPPQLLVPHSPTWAHAEVPAFPPPPPPAL